MIRFVLALVILLKVTALGFAEEMRVAVTTSFHNSGLADVLLPEFRKDTGIDIRLLVVGTGQAMKLGRSGDVDALLVHSKAAEEEFVAQGFAPHRREIMYNDFVILGPADDPAKAGTAKTAAQALGLIAQQQKLFVSRGDDSGTHQREVMLWGKAGLDPGGFAAGWYRSVGAGMGAALNMASAANAYVLSDRASWLNFGNRGSLKILFSGDAALFNQYAILPVSRKKHPHVRADLADKLEQWLAGERGQALIGQFSIGGEKLFVPNAMPQK